AIGSPNKEDLATMTLIKNWMLEIMVWHCYFSYSCFMSQSELTRVGNHGISDWEWEEDEEMIWCYQGQAPSPRNGSSSFAWATCASGYSSPT
ncbi:hypothetical protein ACJX0J_010104, partial [Zea mays]